MDEQGVPGTPCQDEVKVVVKYIFNGFSGPLEVNNVYKYIGCPVQCNEVPLQNDMKSGGSKTSKQHKGRNKQANKKLQHCNI